MINDKKSKQIFLNIFEMRYKKVKLKNMNSPAVQSTYLRSAGGKLNFTYRCSIWYSGMKSDIIKI